MSRLFGQLVTKFPELFFNEINTGDGSLERGMSNNSIPSLENPGNVGLQQNTKEKIKEKMCLINKDTFEGIKDIIHDQCFRCFNLSVLEHTQQWKSDCSIDCRIGKIPNLANKSLQTIKKCLQLNEYIIQKRKIFLCTDLLL